MCIDNKHSHIGSVGLILAKCSAGSQHHLSLSTLLLFFRWVEWAAEKPHFEARKEEKNHTHRLSLRRRAELRSINTASRSMRLGDWCKMEFRMSSQWVMLRPCRAKTEVFIMCLASPIIPMSYRPVQKWYFMLLCCSNEENVRQRNLSGANLRWVLFMLLSIIYAPRWGIYCSIFKVLKIIKYLCIAFYCLRRRPIMDNNFYSEISSFIFQRQESTKLRKAWKFPPRREGQKKETFRPPLFHLKKYLSSEGKNFQTFNGNNYCNKNLFHFALRHFFRVFLLRFFEVN